MKRLRQERDELREMYNEKCQDLQEAAKEQEAPGQKSEEASDQGTDETGEEESETQEDPSEDEEDLDSEETDTHEEKGKQAVEPEEDGKNSHQEEFLTLEELAKQTAELEEDEENLCYEGEFTREEIRTKLGKNSYFQEYFRLEDLWLTTWREEFAEEQRLKKTCKRRLKGGYIDKLGGKVEHDPELDSDSGFEVVDQLKKLRRELAESKVQLLLMRVVVAGEFERWDLAKKRVDEAFKIQWERLKDPFVEGRCRYWEGVVLFHQRKIREAAAAFKRASICSSTKRNSWGNNEAMDMEFREVCAETWLEYCKYLIRNCNVDDVLETVYENPSHRPLVTPVVPSGEKCPGVPAPVSEGCPAQERFPELPPESEEQEQPDPDTSNPLAVTDEPAPDGSDEDTEWYSLPGSSNGPRPELVEQEQRDPDSLNQLLVSSEAEPEGSDESTKWHSLPRSYTGIGNWVQDMIDAKDEGSDGQEVVVSGEEDQAGGETEQIGDGYGWEDVEDAKDGKGEAAEGKTRYKRNRPNRRSRARAVRWRTASTQPQSSS